MGKDLISKRWSAIECEMSLISKDMGSVAHRWDVDLSAVLRLNAAEEAATSYLDVAKLEYLLAQAFYVCGVERGGAAFLLAFDETAEYESPNYQWFRERLSRFVYVDRVVVAEPRRGQGLGRKLYSDLAIAMSMSDRRVLTCEVNFDPPNPVSDAFHAALGFRELGRGSPVVGKTVRYLICHL